MIHFQVITLQKLMSFRFRFFQQQIYFNKSLQFISKVFAQLNQSESGNSKMKILLSFACLLLIASAIPYIDQMCLTNSLIVGRDDIDHFVEWDCKTCSQSNKPIHAHQIEQKAKDVKCLMSVYDDFLVLAFRYTNTAQNVWQDILYPLQIQDQNTCSKCKVQKAYNNMWEQIKNEVMEDLIKMKAATKIQTLYITGISLGGGLASISFIDINHQKLFKNVKVITFGAPRVGNKNWATHFDQITNKSSIRYVVKGDPVTVLPKCLTLLCNYGYIGTKYECVEEKMECEASDDLPDDSSYWGKMKKVVFDKIGLNQSKDIGGIVDHIEGYPKIYDFAIRYKTTGKQGQSSQFTQ